TFYHARDLPMTEKVDYLSANAIVFHGAIVCSQLLLDKCWHLGINLVAAVAAIGFAGHIWYMLAVKFDYGWNMQVCLTLGVTQSLAYTIWLFTVRHPGRFTLLAFILGMHAAMLLEVFDFPPFGGYLDAHAVWHAVTPGLVIVWYSFGLRLLKRDMRDCTYTNNRSSMLQSIYKCAFWSMVKDSRVTKVYADEASMQ
ncbi:amino acid permease, variant 2, partial [Cymbomonas tetramitiformis]